MKPINTLLAILFISLSSPSWSMTLGDLVERDGLYYEKFTDVPFSGEVTGGFWNEQGSFKNGKRDSTWVNYHNNGQLRDKGNYKKGKEEGAWVGYHKNGRLEYKGIYKNGSIEGPWVWYESDGSVFKFLTGTYKDDVKISD